MKQLVDTGTAIQLPIARDATPVIQNLGPGVLSIDFDSAVTTGTGIQIAVGGAYEFPRDISRSLYATASVDDTDVRIMVIG